MASTAAEIHTEIHAEARRVLAICDACGYCNGFCDLFTAARQRPALTDADLAYLANLCHACRNCFYACQYAPPHDFAVNVPRALARMRHRSYLDQVWPQACAPLLNYPLLTVIAVTLAAILGLWGLTRLNLPNPADPSAALFYRVLPWEVMIWIGLAPLAWSALALGIGWRRYWRLIRPHDLNYLNTTRRSGWRTGWRVLRDVLRLRNLRGGGVGCNDLDGRFAHGRRWLHQLLLGGLALSFAATVTASFYHHSLNVAAPYPLLSLPVLLGTSGGIALVVSTLGLGWIEWRAAPEPLAREAQRLDWALLGLLFLVASSGLVLLGWRMTAAMPLLLGVHLGSVLAFFLLLPYSKFVHAGYRVFSAISFQLSATSLNDNH